VSPEYRLAPKHPAPAGAYDVYAGLIYLVSHAKKLGIDPAKIFLYGSSGGTAITASTCLLARQINGHEVAALVLNIPMLDDRHEEYASATQFRAETVWPGWTDEWAWNAVLGSNQDDPTGVRVAGRAGELSNLPLTLLMLVLVRFSETPRSDLRPGYGRLEEPRNYMFGRVCTMGPRCLSRTLPLAEKWSDANKGSCIAYCGWARSQR
jgi:acetyl esterase/lipase